MSAISNYLENALINHILRNTPYTSPGTAIWIALYTDTQGDSDSGTEVSGSGYARENVSSWDAPSNGATANTAEIDFGTASGGAWGTINSVGIHDSSSAGNLLFHGALDSPKTVNDGDGFKFAAGDLDVTLA